MCVCKTGFFGNGTNCADENECNNPTQFTCPAQSSCVNTLGSYECLCDTGYSKNGSTCEDVDECTVNGDNCHPNATCTNTAGSFTCTCISGFTGNGVSCVDVNECTNGQAACPALSQCVNTDGSYRCECNEGYKNVTNTCMDVNECEDAASCPVNSTCENSVGSFVCNCDSGFTKNGDACADIDECNLATDDCSQNCMNTMGGYTCTCEDGFDLADNERDCQAADNCTNPDFCSANAICFFNTTSNMDTCRCDNGFEEINDTHCEDFDECATMTDNCDADQGTCTDIPGGYTCSCASGYELASDMRNCFDTDECSGNTNNCDGNATCTNTNGGFNCTCNGGYEGNGTTCANINECVTNQPCHANSTCADNEGSYSCACNTGFVGDGVSCFDINECSMSDICNDSAVCMNTEGSYTCSCNIGYSGDGQTCTDEDECSNNSSCASNSDCTNTMGSFYCECAAGFRGNARVECADINECTEGTHNCDTNADCTNTDGSFACTCRAGYVGNGISCTDIDECTTLDTMFMYAHNCDANAMCSNTAGDFRCDCNAGYSGNGQKCSDNDECTDGSHTCHTSAACMDTDGSYTCTCNSGYMGDGRTCEDIDECFTNTDNCSVSNREKCINTVGGFMCGCQTNYLRVNGDCVATLSRNLVVVFVQIKGISAINALTQVDTQTNRVDLAADVFALLNASSFIEPDLKGVAVTSMSNDTGGTSVTFLVDLDSQTTLTQEQLSQAFIEGLTGSQNDTVEPDSMIKTGSTPTVVEPEINPCEESTDNCYALNYDECIFGGTSDMFTCRTCRTGYAAPAVDGGACTEIFPCANSTVKQACEDKDFVDCVHDGPGQSHCENCLGGWTLVEGRCRKLSQFDGAVSIQEIDGITEFNSDLVNKSSTVFKQLELRFCQLLMDATNATDCEVNNFSNGSIVVNFTLHFLESISKTAEDISTDIIAADNSSTTVTLVPDTITVIAIATPFCEFSSCANGGTCSIVNDEITCKCPVVYTGSNCSEETPLSQFEGRLTLTKINGTAAVYNSDLADNSSTLFMDTAEQVCKFLEDATNATICEINSFSSGSIVVNFALYFLESESKTADEIKNDIIAASNASTDVKVDSSSIVFIAVTTSGPTTTTATTTTTTSPGDGGLSTGEIIGIVVGAVVLVVIIIVIIIVICKYKGRAKVGTSQEEMALQEREQS
ncbi:fibrillin-1-like [Acanthaster planci]|uniref:Fibrillin-1-like n=1 Tax=Acanthaster planci TaxID=133434 RepID=A0A8B8A268_ACAPL|nr:fibrillin-1-like [Acanthaster planci]